MVCRWRFLDLPAQGGGDRQGDGGCERIGKVEEGSTRPASACVPPGVLYPSLQNEICQCCYITRDTLQIVVIARESGGPS